MCKIKNDRISEKVGFLVDILKKITKLRGKLMHKLIYVQKARQSKEKAGQQQNLILNKKSGLSL